MAGLAVAMEAHDSDRDGSAVIPELASAPLLDGRRPQSRAQIQYCGAEV
ncbi:hypothetical protein GFS60_05854 [Rhodococcus sp. WAY2]|nr:hypothetical protein GFS60_05854 [Rhodococcus sp. WAY2]